MCLYYLRVVFHIVPWIDGLEMFAELNSITYWGANGNWFKKKKKSKASHIKILVLIDSQWELL